jgi:DNA-binding NarL/FixJ family response regulator
MSKVESTKQLSALNDRDALILDLMSKGLTNRAIEKQLEVAGEVVKRYEFNIIRKLAVRSRDEAIVLWKKSREP